MRKGSSSCEWTEMPVFDVVRKAIRLKNATKKVSVRGGGDYREDPREGVVGASKVSLD